MLTALPLPAGRHRVRYWYDPASVRLGLGLSLLGVAAAVGAVVRDRMRAASNPLDGAAVQK